MQLGSVDGSLQTRELLRILRRPPEGIAGEDAPGMPESLLWNVYLELRRRGEPQAGTYFIASLRALHRRRRLGAVTLPVNDPDPGEHRLVDDALLGELWRAYKRCIQSRRTGPAAQLLRDIEDQLQS